MYITPNFSNRKIVQNYRFCIFEGVSKHDLLHSTGHKSLKIGSKSKKVGEFKQIKEILSKIGTEFFKIDEEMTEKNEAEDGNSISLKSPWHMK